GALGVLVLACRVASTSSAQPEPAHARPTRSPSVTRDDELLRLDVDLATTYPLRARIVRSGAVYAQHDGGPTAEGEGRTMSMVVTVVDPDAQGQPMRPRVLCEHVHHRIAVHVDVDDLAIVARTGAVITASAQQRDSWPDTMPGVRLAAGTRVRIEGGLDRDFVRAVFELPTIRAAGFVDREHIGYTWVPEQWRVPPGVPDAKVKGRVSLLAMPSGQELARLDPTMAAPGMFVRRLGPEQGGSVLVRLDGAELSAVGWLPAVELEAASGPATSSLRMIGRGGGEPSEPTVELPQGTQLRGGALRDPIGVVTATARFHCRDRCDAADPVVEVDACATAIVVEARR
ncbi:MAG TPA: hypothetical protein VG755_00255, partial [Nannocystaceae bacterium]|nr:hypothetical protein [Nannocystaceae bacterium]